MKYYIVEIQKQHDGTFAHLVHTADHRNAAESTYHQVLASAAISALPKHSAVLITDEGFLLMSQCYKHDYAPPVEELPEGV